MKTLSKQPVVNAPKVTQCHCGREGRACMWCFKDHPSGRSVTTIRCDRHTDDHQKAHELSDHVRRLRDIIKDARHAGLVIPDIYVDMYR